MKWNDADNFCRQKGLAFSSLTLPGEDRYVIGEAERIFSPRIYKSFSVNAKTRVLGVKTEFYWVTSSSIAVNSDLWYIDEPNNLGGNEECLEIGFSGPEVNIRYLYNDISCDNNSYVLCEGL